MSENLKKLYKTYVKQIKEQNLQNITDYAKSEYDRQTLGNNDPNLTQRFKDVGFKPKSFDQIFKSYKKSLNKSLRTGDAFIKMGSSYLVVNNCGCSVTRCVTSANRACRECFLSGVVSCASGVYTFLFLLESLLK